MDCSMAYTAHWMATDPQWASLHPSQWQSYLADRGITLTSFELAALERLANLLTRMESADSGPGTLPLGRDEIWC